MSSPPPPRRYSDGRQRYHPHPSPPPPSAFFSAPPPTVAFSSTTTKNDQLAPQRSPLPPPDPSSSSSSRRQRRNLAKRVVDVISGLCLLSAFALLFGALRGFVSPFVVVGRTASSSPSDGRGGVVGGGNVASAGAEGGATTTTAAAAVEAASAWSDAVGRLRGAFSAGGGETASDVADGTPAWMIRPDCGASSSPLSEAAFAAAADAAMEGREGGGSMLGGLRDALLRGKAAAPPAPSELLSRLGSMRDVTSDLVCRSSGGDDGAGAAGAEEVRSSRATSSDVTFFFDATSGIDGEGYDVREAFEKCYGTLVRADGVGLTDIRTLPTVAERKEAAAAAAAAALADRSAEEEEAAGSDAASTPPTVVDPAVAAANAERTERHRAYVKDAMMDPSRQSKLEALGDKAARDNLAWYEKNHRRRRRRGRKLRAVVPPGVTSSSAEALMPDVVMSDAPYDAIAAVDALPPPSTAEGGRRSVRTFALVRHPLERSLSECRALIASSPEYKGMTIADAAKAKLLRNNFLTRTILDVDDDERLTPRHVDVASVILWTKALVGLSSRVDESWDRALEVLGLPKEGEEEECGRNLLWTRGKERERSVEDRADEDGLSRRDRGALMKINRYDTVLYENVERMFVEQGKLLGRDG